VIGEQVLLKRGEIKQATETTNEFEHVTSGIKIGYHISVQGSVFLLFCFSLGDCYN
jgi:hypothetical protein